MEIQGSIGSTRIGLKSLSSQGNTGATSNTGETGNIVANGNTSAIRC